MKYLTELNWTHLLPGAGSRAELCASRQSAGEAGVGGAGGDLEEWQWAGTAATQGKSKYF